MKIGELARMAGVGVETVRYYQRLGLVRMPVKPAGGTRRYADDDLVRLRAIRRAQQLGFALADIRTLLQLSPTACGDAQAVARQTLTQVREAMDDLQRLAAALEAALARCAGRRAAEHCPIIIDTLSA